MNAVTTASAVTLDVVVRTEELAQRPSRTPNYERQSDALTRLSRSLAQSPGTILDQLCTIAQSVCDAGSAGVSLLSSNDQAPRFFWPAVSGAWRSQVGGGTPRDFGPCGVVLDRCSTQLFARPQRYFTYLQSADPAIEEGLLAPFFVGGKAVGTVWVISHDPDRHFDAEDQRQLESLAAFASGAYQVIQSVEGLEAEIRERKRVESALIEADQRKNEFLAMLAHELRNPLAPIRNAGEMLAQTLPADSGAQVAVGMIKRQTSQLTQLVDDLLDVARITQGRIELSRRPLALADVITQAIETMEPQLRERQHQLSVTSSQNGEPLYVDGDFARLVQCVGNLLSNAAKYTDVGGRIRVHTRSEEDTVAIEVTDNGAGISAELLPRVFDLFVQSDRTLDRSQGGLGIGLCVVKRLIEMHGGEVGAQSAGRGKGASFEIRLPRIDQPQAPPAEAARTRASRQRVLVVDDNVDAARSLAMLLEFQGHEVRVAFDGNEALELTGSFIPSVVLIDLGLPQMDGYEVAQRLRAQPGLRDTRLVAVTGYGQPQDRERTHASGFDDHLVKPVDLIALEGTLTGTPVPAPGKANAVEPRGGPDPG